MPFVPYSDSLMQNAFWQGYKQANEVINLFVWNFYGEIIYSPVNFPGSWHDYNIASESGLRNPTLTQHTPTVYQALAYSAFTHVSSVLQGKIVRARKANELGKSSNVPQTQYLAAIEILFEKAMSSERKSADWGVRAMKGLFKRLTSTLASDVYNRGRIIRLCCHMYNLKIRKVLLNQLKTVYARSEKEVQPWVRELQGVPKK